MVGWLRGARAFSQVDSFFDLTSGSLGRYYERIADHASSIARRTIYVVSGQLLPYAV